MSRSVQVVISPHHPLSLYSELLHEVPEAAAELVALSLLVGDWLLVSPSKYCDLFAAKSTPELIVWKPPTSTIQTIQDFLRETENNMN